ncbi:MAG: hypothetical protein P8Y24_11160 [Gammaproteobacteria bacterium]|jgi:hypothetical protein
MGNRNKWIMGSAIGLATIAVAIDHTKHTLPEAAENYEIIIEGDSDSGSSSPCSLDNNSSPCSL